MKIFMIVPRSIVAWFFLLAIAVMADDFDLADEFDGMATPKATGTPQKNKGKHGHGDGGNSGNKQEPCLMPLCPDPRKRGARFCPRHHSFYENLRNQAVNAGDKQLDAFNSKMSSPDVAIEEVGKHAANNISVGTKKHKSKVNWAEWNQRYGITLSTTDGTRLTPFEKEQWIRRQVHKFGRERDMAEKMWAQHEACGAKRDWLGFGGSVRLWLLKEEYEDLAKTKFIEGVAKENSDSVNNPHEKHRWVPPACV